MEMMTASARPGANVPDHLTTRGVWGAHRCGPGPPRDAQGVGGPRGQPWGAGPPGGCRARGQGAHPPPPQGDSAVYWAARQGHAPVIRFLVDHGVHVNQQNKVRAAISFSMSCHVSVASLHVFSAVLPLCMICYSANV